MRCLQSIGIIEIVYGSDFLKDSPLSIRLVCAQMGTAVKPPGLKQNYFFLTASWSVIVSPCFSSVRSNKMGDTCCGCKQQQKEKKTTDVIHMLVIHSPAAPRLCLPWVRRDSVVQTGFTVTVGAIRYPESNRKWWSPKIQFRKWFNILKILNHWGSDSGHSVIM